MPSPADLFRLALENYSAGNPALAEQYTLSVLAAEPGHAEALHLLGVIAWQKGALGSAADLLTQSLSRGGTNAFTWQHLGDVHVAAGNFHAAVPHYEESLRLRPDSAEALNALGIALHHGGDCAAACVRFRAALALDPAVAQVHNNLATSLKELGLLDEAVAEFQETLRLCPDHAVAIFSLSELAAAERYCFTPEELERVQAFMASGRCSPMERTMCGFALGAVLHNIGSYDEAFAYYQEANDLKKRLLAERQVAFDTRNHEALVGRIMATFDGAYFERIKTWGTDTDVPVFIVGMPRSGTTLVEQILASHPQVFGAGEIDNIYGFITRAAGEKSAGRYNPQLLPDADVALKRAADYLQYLTQLGKGAARVINKNLDNFLHLGLIAALFPRARIIHCRRHPYDVCLSCYFQNFLEVPFSCSLEDIGAYYRGYEKLMAHWSRVLPAAVHEVSYEELVQSQEAVSRGLVAFCGLEWDERCLTFWNTRRVVQSASSVQVRKPISTRAIGRWQNYRGHLGPLFQALGRPEN